MVKLLGTLIVAEDDKGFNCLWRGNGSGFRIRRDRQIFFTLEGTFGDPKLRKRALRLARKHGVPEEKILDLFPKDRI